MEDSSNTQPWAPLPQSAYNALDEDRQLAYDMGELADEKSRSMQQHGLNLDYSPDSIKLLEELLTALYKKIPRGWWAKLRGKALTEEQIWNMSVPWGAYLGETIRRNLGGHWTLTYPLARDEQTLCLMLPSGSAIVPASKVFKRLADGPADNVWSYYCMNRDIELGKFDDRMRSSR